MRAFFKTFFSTHTGLKQLIIFSAIILISLPNKLIHAEENHKIDSLLSLISTKRDSSKVDIYNELSERYIYLHDSMGLVYAQKALNLSKIIDYKKGIGITYFNYGIYYANEFKYLDGLNSYTIALKYSKECGDAVTYANSLNNIGVIYDYQGNYPKALEYYTQSLQVRERTGIKKEIASSLNNLGVFYYNQKNYSLSKNYYSRAIDIYNELKDLKGKLSPLLNIGVVLYDEEKYDEALTHFQSALDLSVLLKDTSGISELYSNIGNVYFKRKEYTKALEFYSKTQTLANRLDDQVGIAIGFNNIANTYYEMKNYNKALHYCLNSLRLSQKLELLDDVKEAAFLLSDIYTKLNNFEKALQYYKIASETKDLIFNDDKSKEIGRVEAKYQIEKKIEEDKRAEELRIAAEAAMRTRQSNMQYLLIISVMLTLFLLVFFGKKIKTHPRLFEGLVFFSFLLFFEFINVLLDPFIERQTSGFPLPKLIISAILALSISFIDKMFEEKLKKKVILPIDK